jgi:FKBP-type peptidyl-prolyl cis-trans isomerase FkpA
MTEVTRVPILPIKKGSLPKLWLGVAVVALAGAGLAWANVPQGVRVEQIAAGTGGSPAANDVVLVNYVGKLKDGKIFDQAKGAPLPLEGMIPGFAEGVTKMQKGGKYRLEIPSDKAYGAEEKRNPQTGEVAIPANSDLVFEVELLDFISNADFQQMQQMRQAMEHARQGQGDQGGAPVPMPMPMPGQPAQ